MCGTIFTSCAKNDVLEKNVTIKDMAWSSSDKHTITFNIDDTLSYYNIFITFRHNDAYKYNNVWLNVYTKDPGETKVTKQQLDLTLGNNKTGWLGSGMDDIFYHRVRITRTPTRFPKKGVYEFTLEQIMRDDPLKNVLNVGLRVERAS